MGFFSWNSCISKKPIRNSFTDEHVGIGMILPGGLTITGDYGGYGRIETYKRDIEIFSSIMSGQFIEQDDKLRSQFFDNYKKNTKKIKVFFPHELEEAVKIGYDKLDISTDAKCQGYF